MNHPIDNIEWVDPATLDPNDYNPNRVLRAELRLLEHSILQQGWIQPILVNDDGVIIDGYHRWGLALQSKAIRDAYGATVPVCRLPITRAEAMMLTVRINRAKGKHQAIDMSRIVTDLHAEHGLTLDEIAQGVGATPDELDMLLKQDVFEAKETENWTYTPAWYPKPRNERVS